MRAWGAASTPGLHCAGEGECCGQLGAGCGGTNLPAGEPDGDDAEFVDCGEELRSESWSGGHDCGWLVCWIGSEVLDHRFI